MSNKSTLINIFVQGAVPTGSNFADLINSCANLIDTEEQDFAGPISTTKLITPLVSAQSFNNVGNFSSSSLTVTGVASAGSLNVTTDVLAATGKVTASAISVTGFLQASCDISAGSTNVYCNSVRYSNAIGIVSAIGTTQTQAQGAQLTFTINRMQGTTDGQATGYAIPANRVGLVQYARYEGSVSANLWPPTGGSINNLGANTAFALAGGTSYTIFHVTASAYGVK